MLSTIIVSILFGAMITALVILLFKLYVQILIDYPVETIAFTLLLPIASYIVYKYIFHSGVIG